MRNRRQFVKGSIAVAAPSLLISRASAAPRRLRIAHNNMASTSVHAAVLAFKKFFDDRADGRFEIDLFAYSMLGNENQMARAVAEGTLDGIASANGILGTFVEEFPLIEYPYMFDSLTQVRSLLDGRLGSFLAAKLEKKGMVVIGWAENGLRHVTANKPIRHPDDMRGLKLRVQPIVMHIEIFKGLGAAAAPLVFSELPAALMSGQFEAQENPIGNIAGNDYMIALQSHLSLTGHVYSPNPVIFSGLTWSKLSPQDRDLIMEAGQHAAVASRKFLDDGLPAAMQKLKAGRMTIVSDVDVAAFKSAVANMSDTIARFVNADALKNMRQFIA